MRCSGRIKSPPAIEDDQDSFFSASVAGGNESQSSRAGGGLSDPFDERSAPESPIGQEAIEAIVAGGHAAVLRGPCLLQTADLNFERFDDLASGG
jgi:hypothetical protein